jgi:hypothetical protein
MLSWQCSPHAVRSKNVRPRLPWRIHRCPSVVPHSASSRRLVSPKSDEGWSMFDVPVFQSSILHPRLRPSFPDQCSSVSIRGCPPPSVRVCWAKATFDDKNDSDLPVFVKHFRVRPGDHPPYLLKIAAPDLHHRPVFVGFVVFLRTKKDFFKIWILLPT